MVDVSSGVVHEGGGGGGGGNLLSFAVGGTFKFS